MSTRNLNLGDYNIAFVLLAGGQSARYKGNKLLSTHPVSSLPLIEHSVRTLIKAKETYLTAPSASASRAVSTRACNQSTLPVQNQVTVVTGKWHSSIEAQLSQLPVNLVCNTAWKEGMASSIRVGVKHVLSFYFHWQICRALLKVTCCGLSKRRKRTLIILFAANGISVVKSQA